MKTKSFNVILMLISVTCLSVSAQDLTLKVWPQGAPDDNNCPQPEEVFEGGRVRFVSEAEMYLFLPRELKKPCPAVVICPGGGYWIEAMDHEGYDIARWLAERGIAGVVLKYRLPYGNHQIPSNDARRALRTIRANAAEYGINPEKIGIAGSSAGGHLASTAGTRFDDGNPASTDPVERVSSRPDFMLLLYPVVTMSEEFGHMGSRKNLIGEGNNIDLVKRYSNELHVTENTPPTFLVLADDDKSVVPRNSIEFYSQLKLNGVPAEMHIFAKGGHGFGIRKNNIPADNWPVLFYDWLKSIQVIE